MEAPGKSEEGGNLDLDFVTKIRKISFVKFLVYPLSVLDFATTTYGISVRGLDLQGISAIAISLVLAVIFLWVVLISKEQVAPLVKELIGKPIRTLPVKAEQKSITEFAASIIEPGIVIVFGAVFLFIDFWTSLEGVGAMIPFKGILGGILKCFAVFALVFATIYLIYLNPKSNTVQGS